MLTNSRLFGSPANGVTGGRAAIHVPESATLNVTGDAALYAYGGDAGDGGDGENAPEAAQTYGGGGGGGGYPAAGIGGGGAGGGRGCGGRTLNATQIAVAGGAGGAGAGAGIGGNGADGVAKVSEDNVGSEGNRGDNAGTIYIDTTVYTYGGAGGSGGAAGISTGTGGSASGGGGGGFSGGGGTGNINRISGGVDGQGGKAGAQTANRVLGSAGAGGGYLSAGENGDTKYGSTLVGGEIGGGAPGSGWHPGAGGLGGNGGSIQIADSSKIFAFNGSYTTQNGTSAADLADAAAGTTSWNITNATVFRATAQTVQQGIGGGAGYTEKNGNVVISGAPSLAGAVTATLVAGDRSANTTATLTFPMGSLPEGVNTPVNQYKIVASNGDTWTVTVDETSGAVTGTSERVTASLSGNNYTATVTGLAPNADLTFDIFAYNGNYSGALTTGGIHTMGVPLAPENVSASLPENVSNALTVSFTEPEYGKTKTNTIPITYYKIVLSGIGNAESMGDFPWEKPDDVIVYTGAGADAPTDMEAGAVYRQMSPVDGVTTLTIPDITAEKYTGLRYGTVYAVSVSATNAAVDTYGAAATANATTPSIPGPVRNVHAAYSDHLNFSIEWEAPANAADVPEIEKYLIAENIYDENDSLIGMGPAQEVAAVSGQDKYTYEPVNSKGIPGYTYKYKIVAVNAANQSLGSQPNEVTYTVTNPITSGAPRGFAVEERAGDSVTFRWQSPLVPATDTNSATAAVKYMLCYQLAGNQTKDGVHTVDLGTGTAGSGDTQDQLFSTVDVSAFPREDEWQKYDFWLYSCAAGGSTPAPGDYAQPDTNYYDAWQAAIDAAYAGDGSGTGDLNTPRVSALVAGDRALTRPTAPQAVQAETTDASQELRLTWRAPADPGDIARGDAAVAAYRAYVQPYAGEDDTLGEDTAVHQTIEASDWEYDAESGLYTYVISGLQDGQKYSVFLTALNANRDAEASASYAESPASTPAATGTPRRVPDVIENAAAVSAAGNTATLTWTAPEGDKTGGDPVTGYDLAVYAWSELAEDWAELPAATAAFTKNEDGTWTQKAYTGTITIGAPEAAGDTSLQALYSGLVSGMRYRVEVAARNAAGLSAPAQAEVRTIHKPSAMRDVTLTEGDKSLTLNWTAPEDDGTAGSNLTGGIIGYVVESRPVGGKSTYSIVRKDAASFELKSNLSNGANYEIKIWAYYGKLDAEMQEDGVSTFFGPATELRGTPRTMPHAARIGEVATGDQIATISQISAPVQTGNDPGNGGAPVTDYELWAIPVRENALSEDAIASGVYTPTDDQHPDGFKMATIRVENENTAEGAIAAEGVVVPDLLNGLEEESTVGNYLIYVRGVNAAGTGEPSNKRFVRVGMPLAPTGLEASLGDSRAVIASYNAAVSNGTPVKYYEIYASETEGGEKKLVNKGVDGVSGSFTGGTNGDQLWVFVRAYNGVGYSPYSEGAMVTVGAPTTPQITEIDAQSENVGIGWTKCEPNGNRFQKFLVYYGDLAGVAEGAEPEYKTQAVNSATGDAASTVLSGLTTGHRYRTYVTAVNQAGESPRSEPREFSVGASAKPVISRIASADGALEVYFAADDASTSYAVYINDGKTAYQTVEAAQATEEEGRKHLTIEGLTNGLTYSVALASINANGESERSAPVSGTPATLAGQVGGVHAAALSGQSVRVTWEDASDTGGSPIVGYRVLIYNNAGEQVGSTAGNLGMVNEYLLDTSNGVSNLEGNFFFTPDTPYQIGVQAITMVNGIVTFGEVSALQPVKTLSKPGKPQLTEVFSDANGAEYQTVKARWKAPADDGGMPIKGYIVYFNGIALNPGDPERFSTATADGVYEAARPNLQGGMRFKVTVAAVNDVGEGPASEPVSHLVGAPRAPVISSISTTADSFTVTWLPVDRDEHGDPIPGYSVLSYSLYVKEPGEAEFPATVTGMVAASASATSYTRTYMGAPGEYGVRLSANNLYSGDTYTEATVTIGGLQAPADVAAEPGQETIGVTWSAPADSEGVTGYTVFYGDKRKSFGIDELADGLRCTLTAADGILAGTVYNISVAAQNEHGVGLRRGTVSAKPWGEPVPAKVSAVTAQDGQFVFSHTAASCVGFEEAPQYRYLVKADADADFTALQSGDFTEADGAVTVHSVGGAPVQNGSTYRFYIEAVFGGKVTAQSDPHTVVCGLPDAPQLISVTPANKAFTVRLAPAAGSVTAYRIYVTDTENNYYVATGESSPEEAYEIVDAAEVTGEYYSLTYSRMSNTSLYNVWAIAANDAGVSGKSNVLTVRPGTAPAPTIQSAYSADGSITLEWLASSDTTVSKYYVYQDGKQVREVKGTSVTVTGLTNGVQYTFQITAYNENGESAPSAPRTLAPGGKAGAVQNLTAALADVTAESQSVQLRWEQPADTGGLPVTYLVTGDSLPPEGVQTAQAEYTVRGLTVPGKALRYTVVAKNDAGVSDKQASVSITTASRPAAPSMTQALGFNGRFAIKWKPEADGGSAVTGYRVYINGELVGSVAPEADSFNYNGDNEKVPLVASTTTLYEISVKAVNAVGEGEGNVMTTPYLGTLEATVSDPPVITGAVPAESGSLRVQWIAPAYNGNSSITGYQVFFAEAAAYDADGESALRRFGGLYGVNDRTATITGLTEGTEYVLALRAVNGKGDSAFSTVARATPRTYEKPSMPVITAYRNNYEMTETTLRFTYEPPQGGEDMPTRFNVYVGLGSKVSMGTAEYVPGVSAYEIKLDSALQGGVRYFVRVAATNYLDETTAYETTDSAYIQMCTNLNIVHPDHPERILAADENMDGQEDHPSKQDPPKAPGDVKLSRSALNISLEWKAPVDEEGQPDPNVVRYQVYINTDTIELDQALLDAGGTVTGHTYNGVYAYDEATGIYQYTFEGKQNNSYTCQVSAVGSYTDELSGAVTELESDRSAAMVLYLTPSYERPDNLQAKLIRADAQPQTYARAAGAAASGYTVELSWETPSEQPTGYMLYVNGKEFVDLEPGEVIDKNKLIPGALTQYQYRNIEIGKTYVFRLSAFYGTEELVESPQSIAATVKVVEETGLPEKVTGLSGSFSDNGSTGLLGTFTWDKLAGVNTYNVYINGIKYTGADGFYVHTGEADSVYVVEVAGVNSEGEEGPRSAAFVCDTYTDRPALAAPTELTADADLRTGSISLTWAKVDGATGYEVRLMRAENGASTTYTLDNEDGAGGSYLTEDASGKMTYTIPDYAAIRYLTDTESGILDASDSEFLLLTYAVDDSGASPATLESVQPAPVETPVETPEEPTEPEPQPTPETPEQGEQPTQPETPEQQPTQPENGGADESAKPDGGTQPEDGAADTETGAEPAAPETEGGELEVGEAEVPLAAVLSGAVYSLPASVGVSTKSTVPDAPTDFTASVPEDLSGYQPDSTDIPITLRWTATDFWGGNGLTGSYRLYVDSTDSAVLEIGAGETEYTFLAAANRDYSFRLTAYNTVGESAEAADTANTALGEKITPPAAPNVTGYLSNGANVKVLWKAPAVNAGEAIDHYLVSIDGQWRADEIRTAGADGVYSFIFEGLTPGVHAVEVKSVALKAQSESTKLSVNPLLNLIGEGDTLEDATAPSENAALDENMNGVADSAEKPSGDKTVALKGSITAEGGAGDIVLKLYEDGKEQTEANVIATGTVAWESGTVDFTFEVPAVAEGSSQTYTLVVSKNTCTNYTITGITLATYEADGRRFGNLMLYGGDATGDAKIDLQDLVAISSNYGKKTDSGDVTGDGKVDLMDNVLVVSNYGKASKTVQWSSISI